MASDPPKRYLEIEARTRRRSTQAQSLSNTAAAKISALPGVTFDIGALAAVALAIRELFEKAIDTFEGAQQADVDALRKEISRLERKLEAERDHNKAIVSAALKYSRGMLNDVELRAALYRRS